MINEGEEFVRALAAYVRAEIAACGDGADYCTEAVRIVDARNHLFRPAGRRATDESEDVYALRDLCRVSEDTMEYEVDAGRLRSVARNYGFSLS